METDVIPRHIASKRRKETTTTKNMCETHLFPWKKNLSEMLIYRQPNKRITHAINSDQITTTAITTTKQKKKKKKNVSYCVWEIFAAIYRNLLPQVSVFLELRLGSVFFFYSVAPKRPLNAESGTKVIIPKHWK